MLISANKSTLPFILFLFFALALTFQSCKKSRSDMGKTLFTKTKNKVFKDVTPDGFVEVFQKVLVDEKSKMTYPQVINAYYAENDYDPTFVMDHMFNGDLKTTVAYYKKVNEHGINPNMFKADEIDSLINKLCAKKGVKNLNEAYHDMAELELLTANSLI